MLTRCNWLLYLHNTHNPALAVSVSTYTMHYLPGMLVNVNVLKASICCIGAIVDLL